MFAGYYSGDKTVKTWDELNQTVGREAAKDEAIEAQAAAAAAKGAAAAAKAAIAQAKAMVAPEVPKPGNTGGGSSGDTGGGSSAAAEPAAKRSRTSPRGKK